MASEAQMQQERLHGLVERVVFHSDDTGFTVLRVVPEGEEDAVAVTGMLPAAREGEYVEATGVWVNDRRYGLQFRASELGIVTPATLEGIERYLASGMVRGIGAHFASQLVEAFGENVFGVIEHTPERLLELPGIGRKRMQQVVEAWGEQKAVRDIMVFLQSHGVGTARAARIYKIYGDRAVEIVSSNPYRLVLDIQGIGFRTADAIAVKLGIARDSVERAQAGLRHLLQQISSDGHCAIRRDELVQKACALLGTAEKTVEEALREEVIRGGIVQEEIRGEPCCFPVPLFRAESAVAVRLAAIAGGTVPWGEIDARNEIRRVEEEHGFQLSPSQVEATRLALSSKLLVITGGPGVGKTTLVRTILSILLHEEDIRVALCAPTGRAARRLSESTGRDASTIHRLLEFDPKTFDFRHHRTNLLKADLVIVDEASMIDVVLMQKLLLAVADDAVLMIVGDVDQLPSVGPGAVLADIIASDRVPVVRLTEIFRQAAESRIVVNAHRINSGDMPLDAPDSGLTDFYLVRSSGPDDIRSKLMQLVLERIPERFGLDPVNDIQVLTPMNRGGLGTKALNTSLQQALNAGSGDGIERFGTMFAPGDKVIQQINNYEKEVFNGDIGVITLLDAEESMLTVSFGGHEVDYEFSELDELSLAYATTIHKSQGSEYPAVVVPLSMQHSVLLQRNLLYTAVTRGRRLVVIVAEQAALERAVARRISGDRLTNLAGRLQQEIT
ncbi:ATP-dependent RecD-like DNA helicase [Prosthecochloris sp. ZM_2]|uniref:SF1B family DNA helicase RecD2 n=1 Tax=Prosthecochloris sp. ZM_2 TaxID=2045206 RepID=UPI000DF7B84A|nr:ATP-dependent RecD-like DNA helicase [Prosthecochloris sp. ZM_2]RNA65309.1 ATP-dependent RecD-like DNA helicase [Prosthecochloris sp. ZM_2]